MHYVKFYGDAAMSRADYKFSIVAEEGGEVIGHIMLSPVSPAGHPEQ